MSSHPAVRWTPPFEIGLAVITVGALVAARGGDLNQDSAVGVLVLVPSIMWAMSVPIVEASSSNAVTIYRAANLLALVALAVPVVVGEVRGASWSCRLRSFASRLMRPRPCRGEGSDPPYPMVRRRGGGRLGGNASLVELAG